VQRIEDDSICIEDMLRECGVIDQSIERDPDMATKILSDLFGRSGIPIDANLPSKKVCDNSVSVYSFSTVCIFTMYKCSCQS
jgi:hypothetical protein